MNIKSLLILGVFFVPFVTVSQILTPVKWDGHYKELSNGEAEIIITANIESHWHIYSQRPTDAGPIPTSFVFSEAKAFQLIGKTEEENAKEEFVKAFDAKIFVFTGKAIFKQKIKRINLKSFSTVVKLEYMTCNDEKCLPPKTVDLTVEVPEMK